MLRPAPDARYRVCLRTSLLSWWLTFAQMGLSHFEITHWVTISYFFYLSVKSQRLGLRWAREVRWYDCMSRPELLPNGDILWDGIMIEITSRMKAVALLEESEQKLEENLQLLNSIIENQPTCVKLVAKDGTLLDINPAGLAMVKASSKEAVVGTSVYDFIDENDRGAYRQFNEDICNGKKRTFRFNLIDSASNRHLLESVAVPLKYGSSGDLVQLGLTDDITKKVAAQSEKERLEKRLYHAEKMEAIGTLAGGVAHDFNNILSAIIGFTELAALKLPQDSAVTKDLLAALDASNRAKDLVKQILAFSRQTEHEKQPIQLSAVIKEVVKLLRASIPTTIDIRLNIIEENDTIWADTTQIHQVLMNLCTNAYHAMRQTGGTLTIELFRTEIHESDELAMGHQLSPGPHVLLRVSDTGSGIDRNLQKRIFDPYFTTKPKGEGTGMGLAVVHGIVQNHVGHIGVYSEQNKGSTFVIYLPRILPADSKTNTQDTPIPKGDESILVVDDEQTIAEIEQRILESLGYKVTATTSCLDALDCFSDTPDAFDLVITDMTMPEMTGATLTRKLMSIRKDIPIVLCTGFSDLINEEKAKAIGIREYIMKPVVLKEMAEVVRRVLDDSTPPKSS